MVFTDPRPRHPASLYDLEGAPLALDLCQNPSGPALGQRKLCVRLRTPLQTFMRQKGVPGKKKTTNEKQGLGPLFAGGWPGQHVLAHELGGAGMWPLHC